MSSDITQHLGSVGVGDETTNGMLSFKSKGQCSDLYTAVKKIVLHLSVLL